MKRFLKLGVIILGALLLLAGAAVAYVKLALPDVGPAPDLTLKADSAQLARGEYLAHHVALCVDCHSTRDWSKVGGPLVAGTVGKGGEAFRREMGFPGDYYAPNLTPAHLGNWTDGEIYRTLTTGVNRDGKALFPVMPYKNYAQMDPDDIKAIIAYVRTLTPIANQISESHSDFPMNLIINTIPAKTEGGKRPDPSDALAYGKYLTTFASCGDCHTKMDEQGQPIAELAFAGGNEYPMPTGTVRSMNITPAATGIGSWTKEAFIAKFKAHADPAMQTAVGEEGFNSVMPWSMYAGMTENDLGAIFDYLHSLKPIDNKVERFTPKAKQLASR